jgi:hypothetical protein
MTDVSLFRLYVLRATYLLIVIGLGLSIWPGIVVHTNAVSHNGGVVRSVLGAVSLLALLGLRYPLQMLPLLLFELVWKSIWLVAFALPLWSEHRIDAALFETVKACAMGVVIFPLSIPWGYVRARYLRQPSDPWTRRRAA